MPTQLVSVDQQADYLYLHLKPNLLAYIMNVEWNTITEWMTGTVYIPETFWNAIDMAWVVYTRIAEVHDDETACRWLTTTQRLLRYNTPAAALRDGLYLLVFEAADRFIKEGAR